MTSGSVVRGTILLDEGSPSGEGATLHVILEEVSRADAPAREVGRVDLAGGSLSSRAPLEFVLVAPTLDPKARYEVRAHLDRRGSSAFSPGDQITMESHPVLTHGFPSEVQLRLRRI